VILSSGQSVDWARWFWKGAVHIDDVATAVILSLDLLSRRLISPDYTVGRQSATNSALSFAPTPVGRRLLIQGMLNRHLCRFPGGWRPR
jgi:hypothetical protein